jgi:hypothetical protein
MTSHISMLRLDCAGVVMWKIVLCLGLISVAHAGSLELKKNTRSIYIEEKNEWRLGKDLFGMPFIYFSPQVNGQRSNIKKNGQKLLERIHFLSTLMK